jgi:hypothetical protein
LCEHCSFAVRCDRQHLEDRSLTSLDLAEIPAIPI